MRNPFKMLRRCPASGYTYHGYGAWCVRHNLHNGPHRDKLGREWFNLSEVIRKERTECR